MHDFDTPIETISRVHLELHIQVIKAVNTGLTFRNIFIGFYIHQYQLKGSDRAHYGETLFEKLSKELKARSISACDKRQLYRYIEFFRTYPQIVGTVSALFPDVAPRIGYNQIVGTVSPQLHDPLRLVSRLSYNHFEELV